MLVALLEFVGFILDLYVKVIIASAIISWLLAFNVINYSNPIVRSIWQAINAVTEPLLKPIRRLLPSAGGMDFSPIVLILGIFFIQSVILRPIIVSLMTVGPQ